MSHPASQTASSDVPAVTYHAPDAFAGDGVGRLVIDVPGRPVNVLSRAVVEDLKAALDTVGRAIPKGLLVVSGKPGTFVAGADLDELERLSAGELGAYLEKAQQQFSRLAGLACPTAAAVAGACLGGGYELALACDTIVAADDPRVSIGLPETSLGLIPGWGGCVRLPRRVGAEYAARQITLGRPVGAVEALQLGFVDEVKPDPEAAARERLAAGKIRRDEQVLDKKGLDAALDPVHDDLKKLHGDHYDEHYPALARAMEVIRTGQLKGIEDGLDAERHGLVELRDSPAGRNLLRLSRLRRGAKKAASAAAGGDPRAVHGVGVVGGGTMGSGIAHALTSAGYTVTLVDTDAARAEGASKKVHDLFAGDVRRGRLSQTDADAARSRVTTDTSHDALAGADLVLEAVPEDAGLKKGLLPKLEAACPRAVLATNTSSLGVTDLGDTLADPSRLVGMHWFNPVPKMTLVEVVRGRRSSAEALATVVAVAARCGKTPVVVGDGVGFVVNRVLMPYLSEAMRLCDEGADVTRIDAAVRGWGLPMGPFELLDTIGLDVTAGIFRVMGPFMGDRVVLPPALDEAVRAGELGRKTGKGFYVWPTETGKAPAPSHDLLRRFADGGLRMPEDAVDRLILPMVNEAARLMDENVAGPDEVDLATILGMGMPPWRGGIVAYADAEGTQSVVERLEKLQDALGGRFSPAPRLVRAADADAVLSRAPGRPT